MEKHRGRRLGHTQTASKRRGTLSLQILPNLARSVTASWTADNNYPLSVIHSTHGPQNGFPGRHDPSHPLISPVAIIRTDMSLTSSLFPPHSKNHRPTRVKLSTNVLCLLDLE